MAVIKCPRPLSGLPLGLHPEMLGGHVVAGIEFTVLSPNPLNLYLSELRSCLALETNTSVGFLSFSLALTLG